MTLSLDGARERLVAQHHAVVECVSAVWTYKYNNGYTVTLRGPLTVHAFIVPLGNASPAQPQQTFVLRFDQLQFDAHTHEKFISLDGIAGQRTPEILKTPRVRNAPTPSPNGASVGQREEDRQWDEPRILIDNASIPGEPVNAFGIPQATMRCLEVRTTQHLRRKMIRIVFFFAAGRERQSDDRLDRIRKRNATGPDG